MPAVLAVWLARCPGGAARRTEEASMAAGFGGEGSARSIKPEELGTQLDAYHKELHAYILRRLRHDADTEDTVQNVYERVLRYLDSGEPVDCLLSLILTTARNLVIDKARERNRNRVDYVSDKGEPDVPQDKGRNEPQEIVEAEEILKRLQKQLCPLHRTLLDYWIRGMTIDEIAAATGYARRTVETYMTDLRSECKAAWKGE
jgi:RNA polymerase sigma factor (sigma-70 family)